MYVSETTLGPLRITPVAEATNARKSVALMNARAWIAFSPLLKLVDVSPRFRRRRLVSIEGFAVSSRRNGNRQTRYGLLVVD
jgi:hypothetical protein